MISGSANPTVAAWLARPNARNAEMVVVRQLSPEDDDLGLGALVRSAAVASSSIAVSNRREESSSPTEFSHRLLVGVTSAGAIVVEDPPASVEAVKIFTADKEELPAQFETLEGRLVISGSTIDDAALFEVGTGGATYHGWVHHADSLRQLALSSSQRRIRDALEGLNGDPTRLEQLLKLVDKVVFQEISTDGRRTRGGRRENIDEESEENESSVVIVPTLKDSGAEGPRRLSSGDLGLLLDFLMRQLWRSLTHEERTSTRIEGELIGSDDEELVAELPTDPLVAAAWRKKTATLFRRLMRRINEGEDKARVVIQCAAVLGVLEAVRRVEDHDRWKHLNAEFLDRELAKKFITEAVPTLLAADDGILDASVAESDGNFAVREALLRWLIWLVWTVGFGPAELLGGLARAEDPADSIRALASVGTLAARMANWPTVDRHTLDLLEATPRAGVRPDTWLADLLRLGETMVQPDVAARANRPPTAGDLVLVSLPGKPPMFVLEVRGNKLELVDFSKSDSKLVILADRAEILDPWPTNLVERVA